MKVGVTFYGTGIPPEGKTASRSQTIKIHDVYKEYVDRSNAGPKIRDPEICWVGSGGYWRYVSANDVELLA